uniref:Pyroglutamyl-peptidase I n=1 Tax=Calidris pygmaea TaxID=425635 RepID=A0A8C3KJG2_9CHAR
MTSSLWIFPSLPGFGPFGEHAVNASWIAVQELEKLGLRDDVDLHVYEVPVEYQTVQRLIPALWKKHSPQLVVHVGVSGMATTVTLEKCGHNVGYKGLDNCRFCPGSQCCVEGGPECIDSIIDMDTVCKRVSALGLDVTVTISKDAGRYGAPASSGAKPDSCCNAGSFRPQLASPVRFIILFTSHGAGDTVWFSAVTRSLGEKERLDRLTWSSRIWFSGFFCLFVCLFFS